MLNYAKGSLNTPPKITSRGQMLLSLMENVISDLSFIKSIELCVFSQFSVISSWGSGTKPPHYPAIRTQSPLLRSEMRIRTEIGKYACST